MRATTNQAPSKTRAQIDLAPPSVRYRTTRGEALHGSIEGFLASQRAKDLRGKVKLIFTSPPFPLNRKKRYGNLVGEEYLAWLSGLAPQFKRLLTEDGSIVVEVGNSWNPGEPTMSTLALEALLAFKRAANLHLCQQFICHNPARLPSPAQWVNIERIRLKDSFTHVWWFAATPRPDACNRRVLQEYSHSMQKLLERGSYNSGKRPSEHDIGAQSFLTNNGGAIPASVLQFANTQAHDEYLAFCRANGYRPHPARMPPGLAEFFIRLLTRPRNLVFDPFGGSNVTGCASERLKRRWMIVEASDEYLDASEGRFPEGVTYD